MSNKTYEQILAMADKKPLTVKQFDDYFKPLFNNIEAKY